MHDRGRWLLWCGIRLNLFITALLVAYVSGCTFKRGILGFEYKKGFGLSAFNALYSRPIMYLLHSRERASIM